MDRDVQLRDTIARLRREPGRRPWQGPLEKSALLAAALLIGTLLVSCSQPRPKARTPSGERALTAVLHGALIELEKDRFVLPGGTSLSAVPDLVESIAARRAPHAQLPLVIHVGPRATARHLFLLLLCAGQAGIERAFVQLADGGAVEVAVPESPVLPPFVSADAYFSVVGEELSITHELQKLAGTEGERAQLASPGQLARSLEAECSGGRCEHVALLAPSTEAWVLLGPIVQELARVSSSGGSVRLVLDDARHSGPRAHAPLRHAELKETVDKHAPLFEECKQQAVGRGAVASGTVLVRFEISGLGLIFAAEARAESSTITDARLLECVAQAFLRMKFPRPETPGAAEYLVRL